MAQASVTSKHGQEGRSKPKAARSGERELKGEREKAGDGGQGKGLKRLYGGAHSGKQRVGAKPEGEKGAKRRREEELQLSDNHEEGDEEGESEESEESEEEQEGEALDEVINKCESVAAKMRKELASLVEIGKSEPESLPQPK